MTTTATRTVAQSVADAAAAPGSGRAPGREEAPVPDPVALAGIMHAVYGRCEVTARAVAPVRKAALGSVLAELEHARVLGLVTQPHPGIYACTAATEQLPAPEPKALAAARWRGGRFLLASLRKASASMPDSLPPDNRVARLPAADPQIVDAHSALWWAQQHRPAVVLVAADAGRDAHTYKQLGMLALDLALAASTVAEGGMAAVDRERLAKTAYAAALAIGDRRGEACGLEQLGKVRTGQAQFDQALRTHRQALSLREKIRDVRGIISSTNDVGVAQWALGDLGEARASFRQAITLADTCTDRDLSAIARQNLAAVLLAQPQLTPTALADAFELLDAAAARHAAVGALARQAQCAAIHAAGLRRDGAPGDLTMAVVAARDAVKAAGASGQVGAAAGEYAELARCLRAAGRAPEAARWAATAIALATAIGDHDRAGAVRAEFALPDPSAAAPGEQAAR